MGAQEHFAEIITDRASSKINFALGGLLISGGGLARVADALNHRRIRVYRYRNLPANVAAEYKVQENALLVREYRPALFSRISSQAVIVHECVHALIDLNRATATTHLSGEAAGFLAQVLYRINRGDQIREWIRVNQHTSTGRIFHEALQLIDRFNLGQRSARISWQDYQALRSAVSLHPTYRSIGRMDLHGADGIP